MAQCPKCKKTIGDPDFGLVICANCGASFLLDADGQLTSFEGSDSESSQPQTQEAGLEVSQEFSENWDAGDATVNQVLQLPEEQNLDQQPMSEWGEEENSKVVTIGKVTKEFEPPKPEASEEQPHPYDGNYETVNPGLTEKAEPNLNDIQEFANSTSPQDGPLRYTVRVSGIDSPDLRDEVKSVLMDRRLLVDVEKVLKEMNGGSVLISDISAVKAHVIVTRLMGLPIKIEWEQTAHGNP